MEIVFLGGIIDENTARDMRVVPEFKSLDLTPESIFFVQYYNDITCWLNGNEEKKSENIVNFVRIILISKLSSGRSMIGPVKIIERSFRI